MEDVNSLLNSGEVPNLFSVEDKIEICEKMRQIDRQRDKSIQTDGTPAALFNFFITVCTNFCFNIISTFYKYLAKYRLFENNFMLFYVCRQLVMHSEIVFVNFHRL